MKDTKSKWGVGPDHIATAVAVAAFVASIAFYLLQHRDAADTQRKQNTIAMLQIRYGSDMFAAKAKVNDYIRTQRVLYLRAFDAKERKASISVEVPTDVLDGFLTLTEFYDAVAVCREQKSCDPTMVDQLFKGDLCGFSSNAELIGLPQLRPVYGPELGKPLRTYVKRECPLN